jgi:hypothetical protein
MVSSVESVLAALAVTHPPTWVVSGGSLVVRGALAVVNLTY